MEKVRLKTIAKQVRGVSYKPEDINNVSIEGFIPLLRAGNIGTSSITNLDDLIFVSELRVLDSQFLLPGDILVVTSSGSIENVGKSIYIEQNDGCTFGAFCKVVRPDKNLVNPKYVSYFFQTDYYRRTISTMAQGANINNLRNEHIDNLEIPLPDLEAQNKIVAILDKAKAILDKREKYQQQYNKLLLAIFLQMFGNPVSNPKGWKEDSLLKFGEFRNGINYKREESGVNLKCLGVGDFKANWEIKNMNNLSVISLEKAPLNEYFLRDNDLVFVRSNGNRQLVGRCILVKPGNDKITFSGFCIRYRLKDNSISALYIAHLFRVPAFKNSMLKNGRGANIQNINQELLGNLKIPVPPKKLQIEFEKKVDQLQKSLDKIIIFQSRSEELLKSLSQQVFAERITIDIDAELEALISAIDLEKKDEENRIDTIKKDLTFLQRLIDKLREQDFENSGQYEKAKYLAFRVMKEEPALIRQHYNKVDKKIKLII
ncbi:restriction endonuclease subunit S [uncultured Mucilaginibacter sp.]|uniref:restriction endonuclease subunit S n=1 Tax=uncultured Mucilaginibacter sp. TaxID=797541 RepID=UPI0025FB3D70|nr:restriction endonuclease subunit S [uncultured Mucilaginibacter sp.]